MKVAPWNAACRQNDKSDASEAAVGQQTGGNLEKPQR
jgi:hypothetical protein